MVFSSLEFLTVFLPLVVLLYFVFPKKLRNGLLLVFSLVFYAWGEPVYVLIMLASITANDFAFRYMSSIGYVRWKGAYWKVVSLRVKGPDIVLTLGGVWNGPTAAAAGTSRACP